MTFLPDPIEQMEARIDDLSSEWEETQRGVPKGSYRCPYCLNIFVNEPVAASSRPDSTVMCYECLPKKDSS